MGDYQGALILLYRGDGKGSVCLRRMRTLGAQKFLFYGASDGVSLLAFRDEARFTAMRRFVAYVLVMRGEQKVFTIHNL